MRFISSLALFLAVLCVCAGPLMAKDLEAPEGAADLLPAREKIKAKDWEGAITILEKIIKADDSADAYNLLGFSYRNLKKYDESLKAYEKALNIDPEHRPTHEYLGELYIQTGQLSKAREQVLILTKLCPEDCIELRDLKKSMEETSQY